MKRAPVFNGWLIVALSILGLCALGILGDPLYRFDALTWGGWSVSLAIALGARSYQYFKQKR